MIESYAADPANDLRRKHAENAWNNGQDAFVTCDGTGAWQPKGVRGQVCGLTYPVVWFSGIDGKSVMIYPEHAGGTSEKNPDNPRVSKRDYCEWCAEADGVKIHRTIYGPTGSIRPPPYQ